MKTISVLALLLLCFSLSTALPQKPAPVPTGTNQIPKACEHSSKKSLCVSVLNADPTSKTSDLKGLAFIALKTAANTAANTSVHIKKVLNSGSIEEPDLEDGLSNCAQIYIDLVEQMEDSVNALLSKKYKDVDTWVRAAVADVVTCDGGVKGQVAPAAKEMLAKNNVVKELCINALEVAHVLAHYKA